MLKSNRTCAFFFLYLHTQALFAFCFQFFTRLGSVFAEEVGDFFFSLGSSHPTSTISAIANTALLIFHSSLVFYHNHAVFNNFKFAIYNPLTNYAASFNSEILTIIFYSNFLGAELILTSFGY